MFMKGLPKLRHSNFSCRDTSVILRVFILSHWLKVLNSYPKRSRVQLVKLQVIVLVWLFQKLPEASK